MDVMTFFLRGDQGTEPPVASAGWRSDDALHTSHNRIFDTPPPSGRQRLHVSPVRRVEPSPSTPTVGVASTGQWVYDPTTITLSPMPTSSRRGRDAAVYGDDAYHHSTFPLPPNNQSLPYGVVRSADAIRTQLSPRRVGIDADVGATATPRAMALTTLAMRSRSPPLSQRMPTPRLVVRGGDGRTTVPRNDDLLDELVQDPRTNEDAASSGARGRHGRATEPPAPLLASNRIADDGSNTGRGRDACDPPESVVVRWMCIGCPLNDELVLPRACAVVRFCPQCGMHQPGDGGGAQLRQ